MKRLTIILVLIVTISPAITWACPMCKDSIADTARQELPAFPSGFNLCIYYMLASFIVSLGLCVGAMTRGVRSTSKRKISKN